ncbi:hypothetical protein BYT27DRAFT_6742019 [Phlegmacium glaucopus]|nr:hypothetical protein BYT27DRAFT_6742019 [Phlegmacium glaucopus]
MITLFDFIGWIFSVAHPRLTTDTRDNFCKPLAEIYSYFCCTLSPAGTNGFFTVALAYFEDPNDYCILGANLCRIENKSRVRNERRAALRRDPRLQNIWDHPTRQYFGNCAETWFFYLVANVLPPGPATAHGLAYQRIPGTPTTFDFIPPCPHRCEGIMVLLGLNPGNFPAS